MRNTVTSVISYQSGRPFLVQKMRANYNYIKLPGEIDNIKYEKYLKHSVFTNPFVLGNFMVDCYK